MLTEIGVHRVRYINYNEVSKYLYFNNLCSIKHFRFWSLCNEFNVDNHKRIDKHQINQRENMTEEEIKQEKLNKQKTFGYTSNKSKRKYDWRRNWKREVKQSETYGQTLKQEEIMTG